MTEKRVTLRVLLVGSCEAERLRVHARRMTLVNADIESVVGLSEATQALTGPDAHFGLVLFDFGLPGNREHEVVATVRAMSPDLPVVVVVGRDEDDIVARLISAGADDCLYKDALSPKALGRTLVRAVEHRRLLTRAEQSEARLRAVLDRVPATVWTTDADLCVTSVTGGRLEALDSPAGTPLSAVLDAPDTSVPTAAHRSALAGESATFDLPHQDQQYEAHVRPLRDAQGAVVGVVGVALDTSERRSLEDQLRAAEKMNSVGRLAGGVAHDFNNLLAVIQGYSGFLIELFDEGDPAREDLQAVIDAANRATALARQLLAFGGRHVRQVELVDLVGVVAELDKMLRRVIGEDIELRTNTGSDPIWIHADVTQIGQIIVNLAVNARDAMPTGGKLTISTTSEQRPDLHEGAGRLAVLTITDTGTGMDASTQTNVFEPFFSTKGPDGTGLGLSTVHGIVTQSGGRIALESEVGLGTTFRIWLPQLDAGRDTGASGTNGPWGTLDGDETILLVEDDVRVRAMTSRTLRARHYTVLEAGDGAEALQIAATHPGPIHLLATDIVMPGMNGREVADHLTTQRPALRVMYISGYSENIIRQHGVNHGDVHFIQKPWVPDLLLSSVRAALETPVPVAVSGPPPSPCRGTAPTTEPFQP